MSITFQSKRDAWIVAIIWAGALVSATGGVAQLSSAAPLVWRLSLLTLLMAAAAFMLWLIYNIDYTLDNDELRIRCGPFRYLVPLSEIDLVQPSRNPLSSPAASLDRLLIKWHEGRRRILISPAPKADFLRELDRRCPQLTLEGDRLVKNSRAA